MSRSLFELWLQAKWMSSDPHRLARAFTEHAPVREYSLYLRMKGAKESPKMRFLVDHWESKKDLTQLKKQYDKAALNYLKPKRKSLRQPDDISENWWGQSIFWLADKLGVKDEYWTVYWCQSDLVHTGSTSVQEYLKRTENVWKANCYPAHDENEPFTASWASAWFLGTCDLVNRAWSLNLDADIAKAWNEIKKLHNSAESKLK